jgi:hypothetical protein
MGHYGYGSSFALCGGLKYQCKCLLCKKTYNTFKKWEKERKLCPICVIKINKANINHNGD